MKIAVIGGASARTPLLVRGLSRADLPVDEIALFDIDRRRLDIVAPLARAYAASVRPYTDPAACIENASFVVLSIRAGGVAARARDEAITAAHGIVGQETVGPGGFAMAMRNAPHAAEYARLAARTAPAAWVVNFTNPVGIVTQAMHASGNRRVIGICDTPTELFEAAARVLELDRRGCFFDYFGLNHLGWLREVYAHGEPQLARLWKRPELLASVYRAPLFDPERLRALQLLPTEYLFFYYSAAAAFDNLLRAGQTRGAAVAGLEERLFRDLAAAGGHPTEIYEAYLDARDESYMRAEAGAAGAAPFERRSAHAVGERSATASAARHDTGYDRIAVSVIHAIHFNTNAIIPLNVPNQGSISTLHDDDIVEVPCVVNANGAHPLAVGSVPEAARGLLAQVKEYERLTVRSMETGATEDAIVALAANPLVPSRDAARSLVLAFQPW